MGNVLQEKMTGQTMIDNVVLDHMIEKSGAKIAHIPFFAMAETFQDRRCIVECFNQLDFGNGKFFTGFQIGYPWRHRNIQDVAPGLPLLLYLGCKILLIW